MSKTTVTGMASPLDAAVDDAKAAVVAARGVLEEWQTKKADAQDELDHLAESAGGMLLEDPESEDSIMHRMQRLRLRIAAADQAIAAQEPKIVAAEAVYLAAEADVFEPTVAAAFAERAEHQAKVAKLLSQLEELENAGYVPEEDYIRALRAANAGGDGVPTSWRVPKSRSYDYKIMTLQRQLKVRRALAACDSLEEVTRSWNVSLLEVLPDYASGPDAFVPAQAYVDRVQRLRDRLRELEEVRATLPAELAQAEADAAAAAAARGFSRPSEYEPAVDRRRMRLDTIDSEIATVQATLGAIARESRS